MQSHFLGAADGDHTNDAVGQVIASIPLLACQIVNHGRIVEYVQAGRARQRIRADGKQIALFEILADRCVLACHSNTVGTRAQRHSNPTLT